MNDEKTPFLPKEWSLAYVGLLSCVPLFYAALVIALMSIPSGLPYELPDYTRQFRIGPDGSAWLVTSEASGRNLDLLEKIRRAPAVSLTPLKVLGFSYASENWGNPLSPYGGQRVISFPIWPLPLIPALPLIIHWRRRWRRWRIRRAQAGRGFAVVTTPLSPTARTPRSASSSPLR